MNRKRRWFSGIGQHFALVTALVLGVISMGLYSWGFRQWNEHFGRVVLLLDNLMLAKDSLAEGYVWLDAHLRGNADAQVEAIEEAFQRALAAVDAGIGGTSAVEGIDAVAVTDETLLRRLEVYREAIVDAGALARQRCELPPASAMAAELDLRLFTASHGLTLVAESVSADLHRDLRRTLGKQQRLHVWTLVVWLALVGGFSAVLFVTGKRRAFAESALQRAHGELEKKVAERTQKLTETNELLRRSEQESRLLSSQLLTVQEDERTRIAQELHDGITQTLGAAKFRVEHILSQIRGEARHGAEESCQTAVAILQAALDEVRRTYMGLRPSILDDLGILATIGWFCREFMLRYPGIEVKKVLTAQENHVPAAIKTAVFRILQEAMNNVAKHSGAEQVTVGLERHGRGLLLSVEDHGCGFDPEEGTGESGPRGMGLASMRERALGTGGEFTLESAANRGTRVQVLWPV